jgi:hypothetical protein
MKRYPFFSSALLVALSVPAGSPAHGQTQSAICRPPATIDVADYEAALHRMRQVQGTAALTALTIRRPSGERLGVRCESGPDTARARGRTISALPLRVRATYNSAYPMDINNGVLWAGRGASAALSGGVDVRLGPVSAGAYPVVALHQNRAFPQARVPASHSPFSYSGHTIDWPQRHGDEPFHVVDAGQSFLRIDTFGLAAGISTENIWLGPALRMPLLMGTSAAGVPHVFMGTSGPADIRIGSLDMQLLWGRLSESAWFDADPSNDHQLIALLSVVFEPAFARGLFLGLNRAYLARFDSGDIGGMLIEPYLDVRANPEGDNQLFSLYARWVMPRAGFEVYGEWGREDHWGDWHDLLLEPDHSQAYMLGFQKTGRFRDADLRWFGELAHLQSSLSLRAGRGVVTFYTHSQLTQGYTHRGQLLGAWIGPGSDAQVLGVERVDAGRITGLMIERVRFDDDAYYNQWGRVYGHNGHDVSIGLALRHVEPLGAVSIAASAGVARRHNRNFVLFDGTHPGDFRAETNLHVDLDLRWRPPW